jgi:signal transduction histidine kinase
MQVSPADYNPSSNGETLLAYVADLELEVDRLRKQYQVLQHEGYQTLQKIRQQSADVAVSGDNSAQFAEIASVSRHFADVLRDLHEQSGYHPAHDQVVAIAIRPVVEQVFRRQQRLLTVPHAVLHVELVSEHLEWFPGRFRHIVDNLISNALKYRDSEKGECRVSLSLRPQGDAHELRVSDNGQGMPWNKRTEAFELFYRSRPPHSDLGVGLAVVKVLVEQSGGSLFIESGNGQGSSFIATLPRFSLDDYLA